MLLLFCLLLLLLACMWHYSVLYLCWAALRIYIVVDIHHTFYDCQCLCWYNFQHHWQKQSERDKIEWVSEKEIQFGHILFYLSSFSLLKKRKNIQFYINTYTRRPWQYVRQKYIIFLLWALYPPHNRDSRLKGHKPINNVMRLL